MYVRAYQISESDERGTPEENCARAERELRGEQDAEPASDTSAS
jgi:hypothetical protein